MAYKRFTLDVKHRLEGNNEKKDIPCKQKPKNLGVAMPISDKIDFM